METAETPVAEEPQTPEAPPAEETPRAAAPETTETPPVREPIRFVSDPIAPDDVERELDQAITATDGDEMLTPSQRAAQRATLLAQKAGYRNQREDRADRDANRRRQAHEDGLSSEASSRGLTRDKLEPLWRETYAEQAKQFPGADPTFIQGATLAAFRMKADQMKADAANNQTEPQTPQTPRTPTRPVGSTRAIPRGASAAPAQPQKKLTVGEMIEQDKLPADISKALEAELMA